MIFAYNINMRKLKLSEQRPHASNHCKKLFAYNINMHKLKLGEQRPHARNQTKMFVHSLELLSLKRLWKSRKHTDYR